MAPMTMTRLAALRLTIELCDERLEAELAGAEIMLLDLGGTSEEVAGAIGPSGYLRAMLCANRDEQIAAVATWLAVGDDTLH
jgi:hypothetical protein